MKELVKEIDEGMFLADDEQENTQTNKYLLFNIGEEVYGIGIIHVTEIIEMQKITDVPDMPAYIKGVINLRGRVIPVMNLRLRFGMEEKSYDDRTCIIIVNMGETSMGLIVDTVAEVHDILETNIEPPPNFKKEKVRNQYISGLAKVEDEVKIIIDAEKILLEKELEEIEKNI